LVTSEAQARVRETDSQTDRQTERQTDSEVKLGLGDRRAAQEGVGEVYHNPGRKAEEEEEGKGITAEVEEEEVVVVETGKGVIALLLLTVQSV
jgi:hypothetical protein